jgi:hypothetical protein
MDNMRERTSAIFAALIILIDDELTHFDGALTMGSGCRMTTNA